MLFLLLLLLILVNLVNYITVLSVSGCCYRHRFIDYGSLTLFILPFAFRSLSTLSPDKIEKRTYDVFVLYSPTRIRIRIRFLILYQFRIWVRFRFWVLAFCFSVSVSVSVSRFCEAFHYLFTFLCCLLCVAAWRMRALCGCVRDERTNERTRGTATSKLTTPKRRNVSMKILYGKFTQTMAALLRRCCQCAQSLPLPSPVAFFLSRETVKVMRLVFCSCCFRCCSCGFKPKWLTRVSRCVCECVCVWAASIRYFIRPPESLCRRSASCCCWLRQCHSACWQWVDSAHWTVDNAITMSVAAHVMF